MGFSSEYIDEFKFLLSQNVKWQNVDKDDAEIFLDALDEIERLQQRIAELEQERRWIPIDEATQLEHGFYLFENKRGNHSIGCFPFKDGKVNFFDAVKIYNMELYPPHMKPPQEEE